MRSSITFEASKVDQDMVRAEVTARLGRAATLAHEGRRLGLEGQLMGYFGVAAVCGHLIGLDANQIHSAFGLALMHTAGQPAGGVYGDPPAKSIYGAFPNQGGLIAVLLAEQDIGGQCAAFEGEAGLFGRFWGGKFAEDALTAALGQSYQLLDVQFKRWPTSGIVAPFIGAALELRGALSSTIDTVRITAGPWAREWLEPAEERKRPTTISSAANSVFYGVAKALANGSVGLSDFTLAGLREASPLALAERMTHSIDQGQADSGAIEVRCADGRILTRNIERRAENTLANVWLVRKFRDCATFAALALE